MDNPVDPSACDHLQAELLKDRNLIIVSNRGPVTYHTDENGALTYQRGGGGLVTALTGLAKHVDACWVASALTGEDRALKEGIFPFGETDGALEVEFLDLDEQAYEAYYNVIANPLLWFLQHSMWDFVREPNIDKATWHAWDTGYVAVNRRFAEAVVQRIEHSQQRTLVMLQDYHLYLVPRFIRQLLPNRNRYTLLHFIHIPWPGAEDWGLLPPPMRFAILEGLCSADLLGFQTREDGLNFIRSCESYMPGARVNFRRGRLRYRQHTTHVKDFPISIDVEALRRLAGSGEVAGHRDQLQERFGSGQLVVRIDRTEPSKNIVRGFRAFEELLELYPEHRGKVKFLAMFVPSRLEVIEYQNYLDELMAAAGRVNAHFGDSEWEPVRVLVGENYPRAVAALQLYDVLLVNSIADGMNLVAKEGPVVNRRNGVVILSERTGARQQLQDGALVISPCDVSATAQAIHTALSMPPDERRERAAQLCRLVEAEDINDWLCRQLAVIQELHL